MTGYLPETEARELLAELADFRVGRFDLTSLPTVRGLRRWEQGGLRLASFVLGNTGGASGGTGGPAGTERAVCLATGLGDVPHVVVEPDGWLVRLKGVFSREVVLARAGGVRMAARDGQAARRGWDVEGLVELGRRWPGVGFEAVGERAVVWRDGGGGAYGLGEVVAWSLVHEREL